MESFPDQHLVVSFPWILDFNRWTDILLSLDLSVIEVNIGIVCSCLLSFPAFFDRYGLDFGSLISRLKSLTTSWHSEKKYASDGSRRTRSSPANRSDEASMNEYTKLKGESNVIEIQRTFDVAVSIGDVENWPGSRKPVEFSPPHSLPRHGQQRL